VVGGGGRSPRRSGRRSALRRPRGNHVTQKRQGKEAQHHNNDLLDSGHSTPCLFAEREGSASLVALPAVRVLLLRAKYLFVGAIDGWSSPGACAESADQNMTAEPGRVRRRSSQGPQSAGRGERRGRSRWADRPT